MCAVPQAPRPLYSLWLCCGCRHRDGEGQQEPLQLGVQQQRWRRRVSARVPAAPQPPQTQTRQPLPVPPALQHHRPERRGLHQEGTRWFILHSQIKSKHNPQWVKTSAPCGISSQSNHEISLQMFTPMTCDSSLFSSRRGAGRRVDRSGDRK